MDEALNTASNGKTRTELLAERTRRAHLYAPSAEGFRVAVDRPLAVARARGVLAGRKAQREEATRREQEAEPAA